MEQSHEKGNADNADAALRAAASLIAFALRRSPSRPELGGRRCYRKRDGKCSRSSPLIPYPEPVSRVCLVVIKGRHKNNALTQKKSFASIFSCVCDNDPDRGSGARLCRASATPPVRLRAGWRAALRKCDERRRPR